MDYGEGLKVGEAVGEAGDSKNLVKFDEETIGGDFKSKWQDLHTRFQSMSASERNQLIAQLRHRQYRYRNSILPEKGKKAPIEIKSSEDAMACVYAEVSYRLLIAGLEATDAQQKLDTTRQPVNEIDVTAKIHRQVSEIDLHIAQGYMEEAFGLLTDINTKGDWRKVKADWLEPMQRPPIEERLREKLRKKPKFWRLEKDYSRSAEWRDSIWRSIDRYHGTEGMKYAERVIGMIPDQTAPYSFVPPKGS